MQLECRLPARIEAVPITVEGIDYLAIRREDLVALFAEATPSTTVAVAEPPKARRGRPKGKAAPKRCPHGDIIANVLAALPGTAAQIAERLGANYKSVISALYALQKREEVTGEGGKGGVWKRAGKAPAHPPTNADEPALERIFLAALKTGPKADDELIAEARKHGITLSGRFQVSAVLEDHPEVIGGNGGRWTLARGSATTDSRKA